MRVFRGALLAALFALGGLQAAAQVRAADAPAPRLPLSYLPHLTGPQPKLSAGAAFLADAGAQSWFIANRPQAYAAVVSGALRMSDWRKTLAGYDDPRVLREAVLARGDDPLARDPNALLALAAQDPTLAARPRFLQAVALDWSLMSDETRALLAEDSMNEEQWRRTDLPRRYEALRTAYARWVNRYVTAPAGTAAYAAQLETALKRTEGVMTDEELYERRQELKKARAAAAGLAAAEGAAEKARGQASALSPAAAPEAAPAAGAAAGPLGMTPDERAAFVRSFVAALEREIAATPVGRGLLESARGDGVGLDLREMPEHSALGQYVAAQKLVAVGETYVADSAVELGYAPRDLLTDPRALRETALVVAHLVVHELTHHRQFSWARTNAPGRFMTRHYSQAWELEAFTAQAAYLKQKRALDPAFAALADRLKTRGGPLAAEMAVPDNMLRDPAKFRRWLAESYHGAPTLELAGARLIRAGQREQARGADLAKKIDAELARRARAARAERARAEREGLTQAETFPNDLRPFATSVLRRWRRSLLGAADGMIEVSRRLMDRTRAELSRLDAELRREPAR